MVSGRNALSRVFKKSHPILEIVPVFSVRKDPLTEGSRKTEETGDVGGSLIPSRGTTFCTPELEGSVDGMNEFLGKDAGAELMYEFSHPCPLFTTWEIPFTEVGK